MAKMVWNDERNALMRRLYPTAQLVSLAVRLGVTEKALKSRAKVMGLKRKVNKKHPWTKRQLAYLIKHYSDTTMEVLIENTKHGVDSIYNKANSLGLYKTKEFLANFGYQVNATEGARRNRFVKGQEPPNKGKRQEEFMSPEAIERTKATRFKKGHVPNNAKPIGYERINEDGYVLLKASGCRKMVLKHRYIWEQYNGTIPDGHNIAFRDGNRKNCELTNLYLISRKEAGRQRLQSETAEQKARRLQKSAATRNETIRQDRLRIKYGMKPKSLLVKYW